MDKAAFCPERRLARCDPSRGITTRTAPRRPIRLLPCEIRPPERHPSPSFSRVPTTRSRSGMPYFGSLREPLPPTGGWRMLWAPRARPEPWAPRWEGTRWPTSFPATGSFGRWEPSVSTGGVPGGRRPFWGGRRRRKSHRIQVEKKPAGNPPRPAPVVAFDPPHPP